MFYNFCRGDTSVLYRQILAENLINFRKFENITQEEIAFRTGISKETISLIERTQSNIRLDIIEKLACYTGLTIPELFTKDFVENNCLLAMSYE